MIIFEGRSIWTLQQVMLAFQYLLGFVVEGLQLLLYLNRIQ